MDATRDIYYLDFENGSDDNDGRTAETAWATDERVMAVLKRTKRDVEVRICGNEVAND